MLKMKFQRSAIWMLLLLCELNVQYAGGKRGGSSTDSSSSRGSSSSQSASSSSSSSSSSYSSGGSKSSSHSQKKSSLSSGKSRGKSWSRWWSSSGKKQKSSSFGARKTSAGSTKFKTKSPKYNKKGRFGGRKGNGYVTSSTTSWNGYDYRWRRELDLDDTENCWITPNTSDPNDYFYGYHRVGRSVSDYNNNNNNNIDNSNINNSNNNNNNNSAVWDNVITEEDGSIAQQSHTIEPAPTYSLTWGCDLESQVCCGMGCCDQSFWDRHNVTSIELAVIVLVWVVILVALLTVALYLLVTNTNEDCCTESDRKCSEMNNRDQDIAERIAFTSVTTEADQAENAGTYT